MRKVKKCIVVLGMHRSGTSALMGALNLLGVNIGSSLITDMYEHAAIVPLHNEILKSIDSSWDDISPLKRQWWCQGNLKKLKAEVMKVIKREFAHIRVWGLKDPRMCILLPMWLDIFKDLSVEPFFIISVRHPLEIAKSLKRWSAFSTEKSLLLWMKHMLTAELYSRNYERSFSRFDDLVKDPINTLHYIADRAKIPFREQSQESMNRLKAFLNPKLKHHHIRNNYALEKYPGIFSQLNGLLMNTSQLNTCDESKTREFDDVRKTFFILQDAFLHMDLREAFIEHLRIINSLTELSVNIGKGFIQEKRHADAIRVFKGLNEIIPTKSLFWNNLRIGLECKSNYERALASFENDSGLNPHSPL